MLTGNQHFQLPLSADVIVAAGAMQQTPSENHNRGRSAFQIRAEFGNWICQPRALLVYVSLFRLYGFTVRPSVRPSCILRSRLSPQFPPQHRGDIFQQRQELVKEKKNEKKSAASPPRSCCAISAKLIKK